MLMVKERFCHLTPLSRGQKRKPPTTKASLAYSDLILPSSVHTVCSKLSHTHKLVSSLLDSCPSHRAELVINLPINKAHLIEILVITQPLWNYSGPSNHRSAQHFSFTTTAESVAFWQRSVFHWSFTFLCWIEGFISLQTFSFRYWWSINELIK
jgi:hypothetical protein